MSDPYALPTSEQLVRDFEQRQPMSPFAKAVLEHIPEGWTLERLPALVWRAAPPGRRVRCLTIVDALWCRVECLERGTRIDVYRAQFDNDGERIPDPKLEWHVRRLCKKAMLCRRCGRGVDSDGDGDCGVCTHFDDDMLRALTGDARETP